MIFVHEEVVPLPLSAIRLDDWIFGTTEKEYMACARGHLAMTETGPKAGRGLILKQASAYNREKSLVLF